METNGGNTRFPPVNMYGREITAEGRAEVEWIIADMDKTLNSTSRDVKGLLLRARFLCGLGRCSEALDAFGLAGDVARREKVRYLDGCGDSVPTGASVEDVVQESAVEFVESSTFDRVADESDIWRARLYSEQGDTTTALDILEVAYRYRNESVPLATALALQYLNEERIEDAREVCGRAAKLDEYIWSAQDWRELGRACWQVGMKAQARALAALADEMDGYPEEDDEE